MVFNEKKTKSMLIAGKRLRKRIDNDPNHTNHINDDPHMTIKLNNSRLKEYRHTSF
jgi:hypothetical protein